MSRAIASRTPIDVRRGPDGKLFALTQAPTPGAPTLVRISPTTGLRAIDVEVSTGDPVIRAL